MNANLLESLDGLRGQTQVGKLEIASQSDGTSVFIPLTVIAGRHPGPMLLVVGGVHGIEIVTVEIARQVRERIDPDALRGNIVLAPLLNPFAYMASSRFTPLDAMDMNRVFPGTAGSTLTYQMARVVSTQLIKRADYVIDCHSCNPPSLHFTILGQEGTPKVREQSLELARAFGYPIVHAATNYTGTLSGYCLEEGKPCITPEFVFSRRLDRTSIETGTIGLLNVLRHLKMSTGQPEPFQVPGAFTQELHYRSLAATKGGLVYFEKEVGERVAAGEAVATVRDLWGNQVETIQSPVDGILIAYPLAGNQAAGTGDKVAYVAF